MVFVEDLSSGGEIGLLQSDNGELEFRLELDVTENEQRRLLESNTYNK